jgi:ABC-type spermidine/putrescine transport system permease subunit II
VKSARRLLLPAVAALYLPIAILVLFSFNDAEVMALPLSGFTLHWYAELLANEAFLAGLLTSFRIAVPVGLLAAGLGLLTALGLRGAAPGLRALVLLLLLAVFLVPKSVLAIGQAMLLQLAGLSRGYWALLLAQATAFLPFTTMLVGAAVLRLDHRLEEAARDLGASPLVTLRMVTLPLLAPAILAAFSAGMILSLADTTLARQLAGPVQPLSLVVASAFQRELRPDLNAMQTVLLAATFLVLGLGLARRHRRRRAARPAPVEPDHAHAPALVR